MSRLYSDIFSNRSPADPGSDLSLLRAKFHCEKVNFWYPAKQALFDINLTIYERSVLALIGPSGCGKSTFLRLLNRMNDLIDGCRMEGDIHLDGKPHLPANVKLWNADSRGRWEGNTLVVDVTNNNAKARFGRTAEFASENVHIQERFIFDNGGQRYTYVATITDPTVYTRPWTITIPARRRNVDEPEDGWHYEVQLANLPGKPPLAERYERVCVENNGPFGQLSVTPSK